MKSTPYFPAPTACETTAEIVRRCGGAFTLGDPGCEINFPLPSSTFGEVRAFFESYRTAVFPARFIANLPGGRVFGSGNVLSPDGKSIARDVSPDFGKIFAEHWLLGYGKIPAPVNLAGRIAVVATTLGSGYSHWLLEELPRLLANPELLACDGMIAHASAPHARDAIARAGFSGRVIAAKRNMHYTCEELVIPSVGCMTPATVQLLDEFADPTSDGEPAVGEKLYISRAGARRRRLSNEPELWTALESRGFERLQLEELSWAQQIAAFRSAKWIVAPHGAGLANLVFCKPGTRIIELFNRAYVNPCYWQLAALKGLDYMPVVASGDEPITQRLDANRLDIWADLPQVLKAIG